MSGSPSLTRVHMLLKAYKQVRFGLAFSLTGTALGAIIQAVIDCCIR